jgi:hypothetical protein
MDPETSFNLEIRIIARQTRARWFSLNKVVDADVTNFVDLVKEVEDKYPGDYDDIVKLIYFCVERHANVPVCYDNDLLEMFAKHKDCKCCYLTFAYHSPSSEPPAIPTWDFSNAWQSIENPMTPSLHCPSIAQPSQTHTETVEPSQTNNETAVIEYLANPNPNNEHMGVDGEGLYMNLGSQPAPPQSQSQGGSRERDGQESNADTYCETDNDDDSVSDVDYKIEDDVDEIVKYSEPDHMHDVEYDQLDPPMAVGTIYKDMTAFKMALASYALKHEFHYDIEKSDTGRYRAFCCGNTEGCRWRIHASLMKDGQSV